MYVNVLNSTLTKTKLNWWCSNRKINKTSLNKKLIIPKGLFFRVILVKQTQIGIIAGKLTSTRKPFVKPTKTLRR
jgi:hypothetical protein